ncbi:MAG: hypothetical protein ACFB0B_00680 [Thermonemataceae bacterium]
MKKTFVFLACLTMMLTAANHPNSVYLRYYNKDSQDHTFKVRIAGSNKEVTFKKSITSSVTIQGGASEAVIYTSCDEVTVKDKDNITIKDGCIKIN